MVSHHKVTPHQVSIIVEVKTAGAATNEAAPTDPVKTDQAELLGPTEAKLLNGNLPNDPLNKAEPRDTAKKNTLPAAAKKAVPEETDKATMVSVQCPCTSKVAGCDWRSPDNKEITTAE